MDDWEFPMASWCSQEQDGHGADAGPDLDEEMEKVFTMPDEDRFNLAKLASSPDSTTSKRSFGEKEYAMHRKKSYPHMHMPLKSIHSRSMRKRVGSPPSESEAAEGEASRGSRKPSHTESDSALSPSLKSPILGDVPLRLLHSGTASPEERDEPALFSSESEPQVSERAASYSDSPIFGSPTDVSRRVQFQIGEIVEKPEGGDDDDGSKEQKDIVADETSPLKEPDKKLKRKHSRHHPHYHHYRSRKYSLQEDPQWRIRSGSEFGVGETRRISIQPDEGPDLQEHDLDDLASHRFEDAKGLRRYKIQTKSTSSSVIHIGRRDGMETLQSVLPVPSSKKTIDRSPHEVFVQLDELHGEGDEREWKETARWIKYEEDVEEGANRWGHPHVASLSFHSLLNLRRCLETGVVLLDLEEITLHGLACRVVQQMVTDELIESDDAATVLRALLLKHRHVNDHERFRFGMKRSLSSYTSLQNINDEKGKPKGVASMSNMDTVTSNKSSTNNASSVDGESKSENHMVDINDEQTYTSNEDLKKAQKEKESILKRIPVGAEATTVLVGAVDFLEQPTIAFVRLAQGILLPSITEVKIPVRFLFILLGPTTADLDYHEIGRSISTLMSNSHFHKVAYRATERRDLLSAINEFLDDSIVLPPGDWEKKALLPFRELKAKSEMIRRRKTTRLLDKDEAKKVLLIPPGDGKPPPDDPLRRTRKPFGGLIKDIKRRLPHYMSDFTDGFNLQCVAAAIFMYFAALSGAITFGGLMGDKTENLIGISETLLSTSAAGILFALLAGQPLIIVGATGPLLLFDESLYSFCMEQNVDFLTMRVYIGIWLAIIGLIVVFFEGSVLVKLFTRFTEEIFAALISILYIVESVMKLYMVFNTHPLLADYCDEELAGGILLNGSDVTNATDYPVTTSEEIIEDSMLTTENTSYTGWNITSDSSMSPNISHYWEGQPNTALFCLILALGTFFIAYYLRQFRNSKFLGRNIRRALGDFGVPIAIITMVMLDYFTPTVYTEKLRVPEGLSPSKPSVRGWLVSPTDVEIWVPFAACAPAVLVYILLFMETHICELIIDKKDRKLKKGAGFHLDIVLLCFLNVGMGFMGAPWMCAATVRSIAHVSAVTVMSRTHAPGDKPHIIDVKEQRLSSLIVAIFVGISVTMAPLLRLVPISVLFGVFLYMGVSSTNGIQFFERCQLLFMPVKHHPQTSYVRKVKSCKMHGFTFIQLSCLVLLWVVKSTDAALAFPFVLLLMVPLRAQLRFLFSPAELRALDSEEADADEDEPDFYTEAPMPG